MLYKTLNTNGAGLRKLSEAKIKDFKLKIKVAKVMKWFKDEVAFLQAGIEAVEDAFDLENQFNKEGKWQGSEEEKREYLDGSKDKAKEMNNLFKEECSALPTETFELDELEKVKELDADSISDLFILGLITE